MINGHECVGAPTAGYSINWATNPIRIEFRPKQRGGTLPGILKFEGDMLILALTSSPDQGPQDFATAQMLGHYKRVGR